MNLSIYVEDTSDIHDICNIEDMKEDMIKERIELHCMVCGRAISEGPMTMNVGGVHGAHIRRGSHHLARMYG